MWAQDRGQYLIRGLHKIEVNAWSRDSQPKSSDFGWIFLKKLSCLPMFSGSLYIFTSDDLRVEFWQSLARE